MINVSILASYGASFTLMSFEVCLDIVAAVAVSSSKFELFGGGYQDRTDHLRLAKAPLSQMS